MESRMMLHSYYYYYILEEIEWNPLEQQQIHIHANQEADALLQ